MDPLAHTLVGLSLAKSGLEKRSGFATTALVIGANLPDMDGITYLIDSDLPLLIRRGWTHGIAAILILPILLAGALVLLDRVVGRRKARFAALLPLSYLAVATHPSLDWLNVYGLRWLMPFEGTWFYGDVLFIVDPWIWLVLGAAAYLATSKEITLKVAWTVVAGIAVFLVWSGLNGPIAGKVLFLCGLGITAVLGVLQLPRTEHGLQQLNRWALLAVAAYLIAMIGISTVARRATLAELRSQGINATGLMVAPVPITPFVKEVVVATPDSYRWGALTLWPSPKLNLVEDRIVRDKPTPILEQAFASPEVRGFANWARFPWSEVTEEADGYLVLLRDARYTRTGGAAGFGTAVVHIPKPKN